MLSNERLAPQNAVTHYNVLINKTASLQQPCALSFPRGLWGCMAHINLHHFEKVSLTHVSRNMATSEHLLAKQYLCRALWVLFMSDSITVVAVPVCPSPCVAFQVRAFLWDQPKSAADLSAQRPAQSIQWGGRWICALNFKAYFIDRGGGVLFYF